MKCYICGADLTPEDKFCPECGAKVNYGQQAGPGQGAGPGAPQDPYYNYNNVPPYNQNTNPNNNRGNNSGPLKIVLAIGIVMLILAVAVFAFYFLKQDKEESVEEVTTEESAKEDETAEETEEETEEEGDNESSFGYAYKYNLSTYKRIGVTANADYYISGGEYDYRGYRAMDGDVVSSWQTERCPSTLTADLGGEHKVKAISFKVGNWREDHYYYENCRPSKIMVTLGNLDPFELSFSNEKQEFVLEFSKPIKASSAEFTITDFYKGTQYSGGNDDICISEITLYEE